MRIVRWATVAAPAAWLADVNVDKVGKQRLQHGDRFLFATKKGRLSNAIYLYEAISKAWWSGYLLT